MAQEELHVIRVFPGQLVPAVQSIAISIKLSSTAKEVISLAFKKLNITQDCDSCELVEVCYRDSILVHQSEHVLEENDLPAEIQLSWNNLRPRQKRAYRFFLRVKPKSNLERPLRYQWMDCHEGVNDTVTEFNFDLDCKLPDDDLCKLPILDEETLLEHLKERFKQGKIYTYVGEILIAVNPFRFFPIYNPKYINAYNNKKLGSLAPHIFAIADVAYHRMLREKKSQCVVISGESGSGKTESTKLLVHHLTALSHKTQASAVEKTILGVGPVLEAFGNAKTAYNNNSSRFGKFTQIKFREDGTVSGAALRKYLLEKSRIVSQAPQERNYHVFYYLLAGATPAVREELHLLKPEEYFYLNQSECYTIEDGIDEGYEFLRLRQSMDMVGFTPDTQKRIFRVLSAVLHIGNLELARKPEQEDSEVIVKDNEHLDIVCKMLMVTRENLVSVLTTRKNKTRGEEFIVTYKFEEALATRDAMAKALYGTLFDWIVLQVNHVLLLKQQSAKEFRSIGVLDIFGFEDFAHNSYEQFCINFANEKLQKYFNHHIFKLEQDEYFAEGIEWRNVDFIDNSECLELIAGKPTGLLNLIDEESNFPGATESTLLAKVNKTHSRHKFYESFLMEDAFVVKHYAGSVKYDIQGFLDKNRDLMRPDILRALKNSSLRFVRELLGADPVAVYRWAIVRTFFKAVHAFKVSGKLYRLERVGDASIRARKRLSKHIRKTMLSMEEEAESASLFRKASKVIRRMQNSKNGQKPIQPLSKWRHDLETKRDMAGKSFDYLYRTSGARGKAAPKNPPTVSAQFQCSLNRLMEILSEAQPFFVRCVRSNAEKAPLLFDQEVVLRQLRYTGMLETVRIRKMGYPWRFPFEEFIKSYSLLFPKEIRERNFQDEVPKILKSLGLDQQEYQIGKSKIFLRESQHRVLEDRLQCEVIRNVCIIQRWTRTVLQRRNFLRQRSAARTIQAVCRGYLVRQQYARKYWAAVKIQSAWRMCQRQHRYEKLLQGTVLLQTHARGYLARKKFARLIRDRERSRNAYLSKMNERIEREKRLLVRSLSDPSNFEKIKLSRIENEKNDVVLWNDDVTDHESEEDEIKAPKNAVEITLQDVSQPVDEVNCKLSSEKSRRSRSSSDPNIRRPQSMRISRPSPLKLIEQHAEEEKGLAPDVHLLHSRRSPLLPETLNITVNESLADSLLTDDPTCGSFSNRIRRRLSSRSKGKPAQRASTSMIDEISSAVDPNENENVAPLPRIKRNDHTSPRIATLPVSMNVSERDTRRMKKKFFRKISRNSFRRKSEPGLQQHAVRKLIEVEKKKETNSTEDLTEALGQTKIVSTVSRATVIPGTLQWKSTGRRVLKGAEELVELDNFLMTKISLLNKEEHKRDTIVDRVFRKALQDFHSHLIHTYSVMKDTDDSLYLKYEDLSCNFENILNKTIKRERISASFPVIMGVNAFGGVLDEFLNARSQARNKPSKPRKPFKKRKPGERVTNHNGHKFMVAQFSIHTFCEHCNYLIWVLEKGMMCQECRFTCHKKCYQKSSVICRKSANVDASKDSSAFGGSLSNLVSEEMAIPAVVDKLIQDIEARGLYTEGIYRKCPAAAAVKKLKNTIVTSGIENVDLSLYPVHVVAGVLKLFFRQLGHPIITDDLYTDFVRTSELTEPGLKYQTLYSVVQRLPKPNRDTLERLVYHLARLSEHHETNLMNSNALAIIWSPCILRTPQHVPALESLKHVDKQSQCLDTLISGQAAKMKATLGDIRVLEKAADTANKRLSFLEMQDDKDEQMVERSLEGSVDIEEKKLLVEQLETLEQQKAELTAELSTLEPHLGLKNMEGVDGLSSSEDLTDDDIDKEAAEEYAVTFGLPAAPVQLTHLTKHRVALPSNKRLPSRARLKEEAFSTELSQSSLWAR